MLRIEDTDRARSSDEMTAAILAGMQWLGLDWDEGPYHQADGVQRHLEDVEKLLLSHNAYRCFCSTVELQQRREEAEAAGGPGSYRYDGRCGELDPDASARRADAGEPFSVRFSIPEGATEWDDVVHGEMKYENSDIEDFVILRTEGTPTYNLAVVSDDLEMSISHVIRGDDHLSNTPKQILLYRALKAEIPRFAHLPMILGADGKRLSKRHGATAVGEYEELGILPAALTNFLALLGWSSGDDLELMPLSQLVSRFSLDRVNKKSAIFDPEKLEWMNGQYIQMAPARDLIPQITPQLVSRGLISEMEIATREDWLAEIVELLKPRSRTIPEMADQAAVFFAKNLDYDPAAVAKQWKNGPEVSARLEAVRTGLLAVDPWTAESIETALRETSQQLDIGFGKLVQPLRLALTGGLASPGIDMVVWVLGQEETTSRIQRAQTFLSRGPRSKASVIDTEGTEI